MIFVLKRKKLTVTTVGITALRHFLLLYITSAKENILLEHIKEVAYIIVNNLLPKNNPISNICIKN